MASTERRPAAGGEVPQPREPRIVWGSHTHRLPLNPGATRVFGGKKGKP